MENAERLSHAYIVAAGAEPGLELAMQQAAALLCSGEGAKPCGLCRDCQKVRKGVHPDISVIERRRDEKGGQKREIYVEQVRALAADAGILPNEAKRKVYIIRDAGTMNPSAQNALLKLLEEPPEFDAFILICDSPRELLETVRSRCRILVSGASGQEQEIPESAVKYLAAAESGEPARLLELFAELGDIKQQQALDFADGCIRLLTRELGRRDRKCGLERGEMLRLVALMKKAQGYLRGNVGVKHVFGLLSVDTIDLK